MTIILRGIVACITSCVRDLLHICCCDKRLQVGTERKVSTPERLQWQGRSVRARCLEALEVVCVGSCSQPGTQRQCVAGSVSNWCAILINFWTILCCKNFWNEIYIILKRISSQVAREGYVVFFKCFCRSEHYITHTVDLFPALWQ